MVPNCDWPKFAIELWVSSKWEIEGVCVGEERSSTLVRADHSPKI